MIIKQLKGIRVGDKVEYVYKGKTYKGYVAVIATEYHSLRYLLRLEGFDEFDGHKAEHQWKEQWYPKSEKKEEKNCTWRCKEEFKVINKLSQKPITLKLSTLIREGAKARGISPKLIKVVK